MEDDVMGGQTLAGGSGAARVRPAPPQARRPLLGVGLVLLAAALWGTLGTVYTLTIDNYGLTPLTVVFYRAFFGAAALGLWMALRRRDLLRVRRADRLLVGGYGLLGVTVFYVAYIYAIVLVGVTTAVVLLYTAPATRITPANVSASAPSFSPVSDSPRKRQASTATIAGAV
jgi:hypothetical protein